ncbi:hypothetical protein ACKU3Z_029840 [Pseudomonas aeruginosa]|nr:hypothetical protein [Pseudomonas aeruginosa]
MKISQILDGLNSDCSAAALLVALQDALLNGTFLHGRQPVNEDGCTDSDGLFVSFEIQEVISNDFAVEIRPEIRGGVVSALVNVIRFNDSAGRASKNFGVFKLNGCDASEYLIAAASETAGHFVGRIRRHVLDQHIALLESVGVGSLQARSIAEEFWPEATA